MKNLKKMLAKYFYKTRETLWRIESIFKISYYKKKGVPFVISKYARINNFGDLFNSDLLKYFGFKLVYTNDERKSQVSLTGSILGPLSPSFSGYILGSGFIHDRFKKTTNNWKIKIIRGLLSAKQCSAINEQEIIYGDPGILVSRVYNDLKPTKEFELGILPHYIDFNNSLLSKFRMNKKVLIIDATKKPRYVASQMLRCKNIASSSLHGIIFSDSYNIPNIHIVISSKVEGGLHKFIDYYSGMGGKHEYIELKSSSTLEDILNQTKIRFTLTEVASIQDKIETTIKETLSRL